jgi:kumamolisin
MPNQIKYASQPRFSLPGSEKATLNEETRISPASGLSAPAVMALRSAAPVGAAKQARGSLSVAVIIRRKKALDLTALRHRGGRLSRAEYARLHGPDPASLNAVTAFAREFGLRVKLPPPGRRAVELTGTVTAMQKAFGVSLTTTQVGARTYRTREGSISLPRGLYGHVEAVLGLDNRPQVEPHFRCTVEEPVSAQAATAMAPRLAQPASKFPAGTFSPPQVAQLYQFPAGAKAAGQTIALLEFEGGFKTSDLQQFFSGIGQPVPKIVVVPVSGGKNAATGDPTGPDGEVLLDIEVAGSIAPAATIVVYFAPNTDKGFLDAIATAVHDTKNKPGVISISWGASESKWTAQAMTALDEACQGAAALGITITVAAGDNGSADTVTDGKNHTDFPASSPHVLSCGGTKLVANGSSIASEVVWNEGPEGATGGGVSDFFPLPEWQDKAGVPKPAVASGGRGVPDVCGDAAVSTGYDVIVDGKPMPVGGTSAVAPLWAGLIALSNAQNGSNAGFINPQLYAANENALFRDIVLGNNGAFSAKRGWDACTGLGSPKGAAIIHKLGVSSARQSVRSAEKKPQKRAKKAVKDAKKKGTTKPTGKAR